ncbi:hypothetical protein MTR67_025993 [Solanum verrucosum]|uniref:Uncharacterized protein n=1 Tax=Solanum verrucosum TaxID=315347 RepID=A0AAF0R0T6_SOLVR|nr:hypothetical protein MTR67_025993 [Solanum verrucosum]
MLWKEDILAKYGMEDNWITKNVTTPYGCSVSRAIRNVWPMMLIRTKWKFATEEGMLWKEAILAKYGMEDNWITKNVTTPYGCSVSRAIRNLWPMMQIRTKGAKCKSGEGKRLALLSDVRFRKRTSSFDVMFQDMLGSIKAFRCKIVQGTSYSDARF